MGIRGTLLFKPLCLMDSVTLPASGHSLGLLLIHSHLIMLSQGDSVSLLLEPQWPNARLQWCINVENISKQL